MNDEELKKKLSILKSAPVPKGYWENYWPKLRDRLEAYAVVVAPAGPRPGPTPLEGIATAGSRPTDRRDDVMALGRWLVPAFALVLPVLIGVYWLGHRSARSGLPSIPGMQLVSVESDSRAQKVFKEMLELFPNRVNWITFVNGKVDFSISSMAYQKEQVLVPLVVVMPRPNEEFEARFLMRPGQDASVHAAWDSKTKIEVKVTLSRDGLQPHATVHLDDGASVASVEGSAKLHEGQGAIVGAIKWQSQLFRVQLTRMQTAGAKHPEKTKERESASNIEL